MSWRCYTVSVAAMAVAMSNCSDPGSGTSTGSGSATHASESGATGPTTGDSTTCGDGITAPAEFCFEPLDITEITGVQRLIAEDMDGDGIPELLVLHLEEQQRRLVAISFASADGVPRVSEPVFPSSSYMMLGRFRDLEGVELALLDPSGGSSPLSFITFDDGVLSEPEGELLEGDPAVAGAPVDVDGDGSSELYLVTVTETETSARIFGRQGSSWVPDPMEYPFMGVIDRNPATVTELDGTAGPVFVAALAGLVVGPEDYDQAVHRLAIYDPSSLPMEELANVAAGTVPAEVRAGDVDGDGAADVVVAGWGTRVSVLRTLGGGTLADAVLLDVGANNGGPRIVVANLDGDADKELGVSGGALEIIDDPLGTETRVALASESSDSLAAADFNRDGIDDIACAPGRDAPLRIFMSAP